jgi:transcription antitermination factor NusG
MADANWYVVHTYSGYENKVKADIEKTIENRNLQDFILEVLVPMQEVVEMKNGARKTNPEMRMAIARKNSRFSTVNVIFHTTYFLHVLSLLTQFKYV